MWNLCRLWVPFRFKDVWHMYLKEGKMALQKQTPSATQWCLLKVTFYWWDLRYEVVVLKTWSGNSAVLVLLFISLPPPEWHVLWIKDGKYAYWKYCNTDTHVDYLLKQVSSILAFAAMWNITVMCLSKRWQQKACRIIRYLMRCTSRCLVNTCSVWLPLNKNSFKEWRRWRLYQMKCSSHG